MKLPNASKFLVLGLSGTLALCSIGCGPSSSASSSQSAEPSSVASSSEPNNSTTVGNATSASSGHTYTNEALGFAYTLPQGFTVISSSDSLDGGVLLEANEGDGNEIVVEATRADLADNPFSTDYLDTEISNAEQKAKGDGYEVSDTQKVGLTIGDGTTIPSISLTLQKDGNTVYKRQAYVLGKDCIVTVSAQSAEKGTLNEILQGIGQAA